RLVIATSEERFQPTAKRHLEPIDLFVSAADHSPGGGKSLDGVVKVIDQFAKRIHNQGRCRAHSLNIFGLPADVLLQLLVALNDRIEARHDLAKWVNRRIERRVRPWRPFSQGLSSLPTPDGVNCRASKQFIA